MIISVGSENPSIISTLLLTKAGEEMKEEQEEEGEEEKAEEKAEEEEEARDNSGGQRRPKGSAFESSLS